MIRHLTRAFLPMLVVFGFFAFVLPASAAPDDVKLLAPSTARARLPVTLIVKAPVGSACMFTVVESNRSVSGGSERFQVDDTGQYSWKWRPDARPATNRPRQHNDTLLTLEVSCGSTGSDRQTIAVNP